MEANQEERRFLNCERRIVFYLLIASAGMMGAYTFNVRGGVFCNAQTANVVMMSMALGKGRWLEAVYFLIPITAYLSGSLISEALSSSISPQRFMRWDTSLIFIESLVLFGIGFIPLSWPHQIVQVTVNFIAAMQYNTFRQAEGVPVATTFCTNHVRQTGIAFARLIFKRDRSALARGLLHVRMLGCFLAGGIVLTCLCGRLGGKAIWITLVPLGIVLAMLLYGDFFLERGNFIQKPSGH